jgi:hypothetical protein
VYNDHPWDPKKVAVVQRWLLFRGGFSEAPKTEIFYKYYTADLMQMPPQP